MPQGIQSMNSCIWYFCYCSHLRCSSSSMCGIWTFSYALRSKCEGLSPRLHLTDGLPRDKIWLSILIKLHIF